jgi:hypothetical protein
MKWGPFVTWRTIFDHPEFKKLIAGARIEPWTGKPTDLEPPLPQAGNGNAIVQWFIPFAGQTGQGYVWLSNGRTAAVVHGKDILVQPDEDGVKRLWRGDEVSFKDKVPFGNGKNDKLTQVRLVRRCW